MKIDLTEKLTTFNGVNLRTEESKDSPLMDTRYIILEALGQPDNTVSYQKHLGRNDLARKIIAADKEIELKAEEIAELKILIHRKFPTPIVIGRMEEVFEKGKIINKDK